MTAFAADAAGSNLGTLLTARTGAASGDSVPGGAYVVWRNTGAGSHTVTLGNNYTPDGLVVTGRAIVMGAGTVYGGRIEPRWADASNQVSVAISAANPNEVVYYVVGGI